MELNSAINAIEDEWKLVEYKQNDSEKIWFFRKNIGASSLKNNASLATLVYFTVGFESDKPSGLPSKEDTDKLYDFEDNIIPKVETEAHCVMVASVIKDGVKDHLFYVSNTDKFLISISKYKNALDGFQVSLEKVDDPNWEIYDDFPDGI